MSTPFAVGCAALLLSYVRNNNIELVLDDDNDYRKVLRKKTISLKNKDFAGKKFFEGFGIIDPNQFEEWVKNN